MAVVGPVVGIVTDRRLYDGMAVHQANDEYIAAIQGGAGALPLLIPSSDTPLDSAALLQAVAGLLFTGSASNVDPVHYGAAARPGTQIVPSAECASLLGPRCAATTGELLTRPAGLWTALDLPLLDVSSTRIRRLLKSGVSVRGLVPDAIMNSWTAADVAALVQDDNATTH